MYAYKKTWYARTASNGEAPVSSTKCTIGISKQDRDSRIMPEDELVEWSRAYIKVYNRHPCREEHKNAPVFTLVEKDGVIVRQNDPWVTWNVIIGALRHGKYGLEGGRTLYQFLQQNGLVVTPERRWDNGVFFAKKLAPEPPQ